MVVICEATGMAIIYFIQLAKEDENLLLLLDFVTWLALGYSLEIKVIRLDNKINQIKTKDWCNNVSILFELYTLNTYTQNGGTYYFGCLIMKNA